MITVKHSANIGDLIATLAGLRGYYERNGKQFDYFQQINIPAHYHKDYYHPTQHNNGLVYCNKGMFDFVKPLVEYQSYINEFKEYKGEDVVVNLDDIRLNKFVNIPNGSLVSWYALAFPDLHWDISKAWIDAPNMDLPEKVKGKIIVNFTCRYRNDFINYNFLREHEKDILFAGTITELNDFCELWDLNLAYLQLDNALEYAAALKGAKFFLGNQSFGWNLANGLGVPRILEMYPYAANCIPFVGKHNYGFYHQEALEYYFNEMIKL